VARADFSKVPRARWAAARNYEGELSLHSRARPQKFTANFVMPRVRSGATAPTTRLRPPRVAAASRAKLRAVVVEDETMFRQLIRTTLGTIADVEVVGEFGLGRPALEFCLKHPIDLLVVDLLLPDIEGLEIARRVKTARDEVIILVITAHPSERLPAELMALGVAGYVDKNESIDYVVNAVETLRRGGMFFASHVQAQRGSSRGSINRHALAAAALTAREQEIAQLVASGKMSKEIAALLDLSPRTVENHRAVIMRKVGVHDVASLTRWCIETGLVYT
jgi:DNA-binding NarL/FixJ family response regulator